MSCQIGEINLLAVAAFDISEGRLDGLHTLVKIFFRGHEKPVGGECGQDIKKEGFDVQLAGQVVGDEAAVGSGILRPLAEGAHDIQKGVSQRQKRGMLRLDTARKEQLPVLNRLYQMNLRLVIGVEAQDAGGEDYGVLPMAGCSFRDDAVQFAGVDEVETFRSDRKRLHIDFQPKFSAGKIQNFRLIMPMMFDERAFSHGVGAVGGTGEGLGSVRPDFFENRRRLVCHGKSPYVILNK